MKKMNIFIALLTVISFDTYCAQQNTKLFSESHDNADIKNLEKKIYELRNSSNQENLNTLKELIEKEKVHVDGVCSFGRTALMDAVCNNCQKSVIFLLSKGADVSHIDNYDQGVLIEAKKSFLNRFSHFSSFKKYEDYSTMINILKSHIRNHKQIVKTSLNQVPQNIIEDVYEYLYIQPHYQKLPSYLSNAINLADVKRFVDAGGNINATENKRNTLLHLATQQKDYELINFLGEKAFVVFVKIITMKLLWKLLKMTMLLQK